LFGVESEMTFQGLGLTKEIEKNPDEYAEQFMKFFKEMIGLSEVGAVSLASKARAVDIFGAEKVKLAPPILTKKKEKFLKEHIVEKVNQLERNVKKTAIDHVLRYVSRIEALIHDNTVMTLADNSDAYNCRMESTSLTPEEEDEVYVVQWDYRCQHTGNIS